MPEGLRKVPKRLWHMTPPIFTDCAESGPTEEEIELARELFKILDEQSQEWYRRCNPRYFDGLE
jgi:hypothetical protein